MVKLYVNSDYVKSTHIGQATNNSVNEPNVSVPDQMEHDNADK